MMAKSRFLYCKLFSFLAAVTILFSSFVSVVSQRSSAGSHVGNAADSLNITALPPSVAQIVEAISNVQKNVSKNASKSKAPNIKVAGLIHNNEDFRSNLTASSEPNLDLELQLYEPEESLIPERLDEKNEQNSDSEDESTSPVTTTNKPAISTVNVRSTTERAGAASHTTIKVEKRPNVGDNAAEATEDDDTTLASLDPPAAGLLSFEGARQWFNWVWSMRDPSIHPEGPFSWPTIIGRGLSTIIRYYNPLRRIFGMRSLGDPVSVKFFTKDHPYRDEILKAIKNKEIPGDVESINAFVHELQRVKIAEKISAMSNTNQSVSGKEEEIPEVVEDPEPLLSFRPLAAPLADAIESIRNMTENIENAIFAPFDVVPTQVDAAADLFDAPFNTVIRVPFYIKYANLILKALYILIPLIYIPFSGVENFFLAPLPPEMDTFPGMLRFFGLQAMLGPDYLYDYSDDEEAEGDDATSAAEDDEEYYDYEYEDDVRRNRRKDELSEKNKKPKKRKRFKKKQSQEEEEEYIKEKETRYTNLASEMRPPPSKYGGQSSYTSIMATQEMQPVYIYPVSDSNHPKIHHTQAVLGPEMHGYYNQWPHYNLPPSFPSAQVISPHVVPDPSVSASLSAVEVPSAVLHASQKEPVVPVPLAQGIPTFDTPMASGGPGLSVPLLSPPSYHGALISGPSSSIQEHPPSEIVHNDRAGVSHYKPPAKFRTQSARPLLQSGSNDALFSQVEEIRENFLIAPNYSGTAAKLATQSLMEVPHTSTSTTPAVQTEATTSDLRPIYVTAPTIIRTSTVFNNFPSTASVTP